MKIHVFSESVYLVQFIIYDGINRLMILITILQLKVLIDGVAQPDYKPFNSQGYETLGNGKTAEFCIGGE